MALETTEMGILGKLLLLVHRWLDYIHLVAPGGPSRVLKLQVAQKAPCIAVKRSYGTGHSINSLARPQ